MSLSVSPGHPAADEGYRLELVPSAHVPEPGVWHRMCVVARDNEFEVLLGEAGEYRRLRVDALPDVGA